MDTATLLKQHQYSKSELNEALFRAVLSDYDNTAIIDLLIGAGADVNAKGAGEITPLILAVQSPCNIRPLIAHGGRVGDHDKWGSTALEYARHNPAAMRILENAAAVH